MMQRSPIPSSASIQLDQQPYYGTQPEQNFTTQRRTWGQPQPIHFATNSGLGYDRTKYGGPVPGHQTMYEFSQVP